MSSSSGRGPELKSCPSHANDLNIDMFAATLPDAWHFRSGAMTSWPSVSILNEKASSTCKFMSVRQHVELAMQICF